MRKNLVRDEFMFYALSVTFVSPIPYIEIRLSKVLKATNYNYSFCTKHRKGGKVLFEKTAQIPVRFRWNETNFSRNFTKPRRFVSRWVQGDCGKRRESHRTLSRVSFAGKLVLFYQQDAGNWQESKSRYEKSSRIHGQRKAMKEGFLCFSVKSP